MFRNGFGPPIPGLNLIIGRRLETNLNIFLSENQNKSIYDL
jgi:hypothetical protein